MRISAATTLAACVLAGFLTMTDRAEARSREHYRYFAEPPRDAAVYADEPKYIVPPSYRIDAYGRRFFLDPSSSRYVYLDDAARYFADPPRNPVAGEPDDRIINGVRMRRYKPAN